MQLDSAVAPFVATAGAGFMGGAGGGTTRESGERYELESGEPTQPESTEDKLTCKCRDLAKMKAELLRAQQDLQSKVDELDRCLRQLESGQPKCLPAPLPDNEIPTPELDSNAAYPRPANPVEQTGGYFGPNPTLPVRMFVLPEPGHASAYHQEQGVRPSSYVTRDIPRNVRSTPPRLRRLPPVDSTH